MKEANLTYPEIGLFAATRGMIAAGGAILLSGSMDKKKRRAIGWPLLIVGAASTVPLVMRIAKKTHDAETDEQSFDE
jgi:hypothetical protein